jgi:hypothetical protein
MIAVPPLLKAKLRLLPEYGMGYQIGFVCLNTGSFESGVILNGSYFVPKTELAGLTSFSQQLEEMTMLANAKCSSLSIESATLTPRSEASLRRVKRIQNFSTANDKSAAAAKDSKIVLTSRYELFKRFSAYADDFRVTEKQGLVPNTYATTAEDAQNVKTGMDAISRYALENKISANNVFTILPPEKTRLQRGIVEPAYGEPGGGVEVIFVDGTPDYTVSGPEKIPEK